MSRVRATEFEERDYYPAPRRSAPEGLDEVDYRRRTVTISPPPREESRTPAFLREDARRTEAGPMVLRQRQVETIDRHRPRSPSPVRVREERIIRRPRSISPSSHHSHDHEHERSRTRVYERERVREPSQPPPRRAPSPARVVRYVERPKSPSPPPAPPVEERERIRTRIIERERAPSPPPVPKPSPPPPPPQTIRGPTIEREVITHYRDIDHGMIKARPPTPPPQPKPQPRAPSRVRERETDIDISLSKNRTEVDVTRTSRTRSQSQERRSDYRDDALLLYRFFLSSSSHRRLKMKISYLSVGLLALFSPLAAAWSKEDREIFRIRDEISKYETDPAATFYDILGVPPSASLDDITKAYRKQTRNLHPDKVRQGMRSKAGKDKKAGAKTKPPTNAEIKAAVKKAGEAQARLSLIANILRGPERDRYDHFLSNGFPLWKGTDYYYNRYRPGLGTVIVGLFLVVGGGIHYLTLYMSWKRQKEFVERYIKFARDTAWGGGLNIPGVDAAPAPAPAASPAPASDEEEAPPLPQNRRERRMQEKAAKRDGARPAKKTRRAAQASSGTATPTPAAGPTGARKRVVAENGKILVVDSLGDVYLEGEDEEGEVHEFLLDPNELAKPTIKDTAVFRAPIFLFNITAGRFLSKKPTDLEIEIPAEDEDSDVPQPTPSTDSAGEDFELLDKSTDSLTKAKASGASQGKANKRKGKKR